MQFRVFRHISIMVLDGFDFMKSPTSLFQNTVLRLAWLYFYSNILIGSTLGESFIWDYMF